MGIRFGVPGTAIVALTALLLAGCGGDQSGEEAGGDSGGQYEGGEPTSVAAGDTGFSEESCLREASESGPAEVDIQDPGEVPDYEVVGESRTGAAAEFEVVTPAASREDLKAVAEDLRFENRDRDALSVDFYNEVSGDERQDAGLALVFNTREAACRVFQYPVEDQNQLISESNGVSVVSVEEGV